MKHLLNSLLIIVLTTGGMAIMSPAMAEGKGMQGMKHHGKHHEQSWKATLTDAQRKEINKLKLAHKRKVYPLKAQIKQAKVELALLVTSDNPQKNEISQAINRIVRLKAEKIHLKTVHRINVRSVLNEDQRVLFDLKVLKKAYKGKKHHKKGHSK
ncbi:MAG: periplasmic heavy metal sensor [Gammaproteobacteria bacterium]|nr:periplasmic heavy metal sensor [Gammaproteobacteria bacterium]